MNKKYNELSIREKISLISESEGGVAQRKLAERYRISKGQVSNILKRKSEILNYDIRANDSRRTRLKRISKYEDLNKLVYNYFHLARSKGFPMSGPLLKEKANIYAEKLDIQDFKASEGWLERFKKRSKIEFKTICGESASVDIKTVDEWKSKLLSICDGYDEKDIFNLDETGLFFRLLPNKTLSEKGEACSGGKVSKDRLTVLLCVSMQGEKLKPLVIGKYKKPRCFKNIQNENLPTLWRWNAKAWTNTALFEEWIVNLNASLVKKKRKIILFLDNASAHVNINLTNIKLQFFPANTTACLQPLDQGIIRSFKVYYRKFLLRRLLSLIEGSNKIDELIKGISSLDALYWIKDAWDLISKETIHNCFRKAGFPQESQDLLAISSDDKNMSDEENELICMLDMIGVPEITTEDVINFDSSLPVADSNGDKNLEDAVFEDFLNSKNVEEIDEKSEVNDDDTSEKYVTYFNIKESLNTIKSFIMSNEPSLLKKLYELQSELEECHYKAQKNIINDIG
jgi:hypothetical protein